MPYVTFFEITQKPYQWWFPAFGLIFVLIGTILVWNGRRKKTETTKKLVGYFILLFASLWVFCAFVLTFFEYRQCINAYRNGNYAVVEGRVENFHPMPYEGHSDETFTVGNESFSYSDYDIQPGFNQAASHGGPIRDGLQVRIAYYDGQILRLEIRADSVPSTEARSTYASKAEAKWNQWMKTDPNIDHMTLGFSFAAFLIILCWNLDWRHFIRYWLRREPPYTRYWEIGFRVFFAACLIGTVIQLVLEISERPRTAGDYGAAGLDSLIYIGFFVLADIFFRWRKQKSFSVNPSHPTGDA
ncbi:MAG TPA: hypothetical protein VMG59_11300 [Phycisphaerae bacterium]|nr:hypothetical protein [Phycisphaerae bacterium]